MEQQEHPHRHDHSYSHSHNHDHVPNAAHPWSGHQDHEQRLTSRRDFLHMLMGGALSGASFLEIAYHRAAWARTATPAKRDANLFDIQKAANGVFFAQARPQTEVNCNAAIFVRSNDVVVVDAHSKPSAAAALIAQIKREITPNPVRYVVNTHFHWDHTQGNHAYRAAGGPVDFIATSATKHLMSQLSVVRMKASVDAVPKQIEELRLRAEHATSEKEKAFCADEISHLKAYQAEMKDFTLELPTITFDKSYVVQDRAFDMHLEFHGHAHTAGDLFVFCPQQRAIATGDACIGWIPNLADGFPKSWPRTLDEVAQADFKYVLGGHGPLQSDRTIMTNQRNYIEELTSRVEQAKESGLSIEEMQKRFTVASLGSLRANGYGEYLTKSMAAGQPHFGEARPLQDGVNRNIGDIYKNLDRL